jgi:hypothetical protein
MTSFAVLLAPLAVGTLADATSLKVALGVVPVGLALAAAGLTLVRRARTRASGAPEQQLRRRVLGEAAISWLGRFSKSARKITRGDYHAVQR